MNIIFGLIFANIVILVGMLVLRGIILLFSIIDLGIEDLIWEIKNKLNL